LPPSRSACCLPFSLLLAAQPLSPAALPRLAARSSDCCLSLSLAACHSGCCLPPSRLAVLPCLDLLLAAQPLSSAALPRLAACRSARLPCLDLLRAVQIAACRPAAQRAARARPAACHSGYCLPLNWLRAAGLRPLPASPGVSLCSALHAVPQASWLQRLGSGRWVMYATRDQAAFELVGRAVSIFVAGASMH